MIFEQKDNEWIGIRGIFKIKNTDGKTFIVDEIADDLGPEHVRIAMAHALVQMNKEAIMQGALIVAEQALTRKPVSKLRSFFKQKKQGKKLEMKSSRGCVSLMIGEEETIL